jgi:hypothetical protein
MSTNVTQRVKDSKILNFSKMPSVQTECSNLAGQKIPTKKVTNCKSQRIENKAKSRVVRLSKRENLENDKNVVNLNKEFFSKKTEEKKVVEQPKASILEVINDENMNESMRDVLPTDINDLNVTMKSSKDDSAIKENEGERVFREQVLGGVIKLDSENPILEEKKNKVKDFTKTIKSVSIPVNMDKTQTLNSENLQINKQNAPKFTNEEYRRMTTALLRKDYSKAILENLFEDEEVIEDPLGQHKITERMRCRMVDWMIEVLTNYRCEDHAFFIAINLMDRYFKAVEANNKFLQPVDLHLVGVTTMFMASKYQDIYPLRLKVVHEKIAHKKLSVEEIKSKEEDISRYLNYIVGKPTQWDFINHFVEELFFTNSNDFHLNNSTLLSYLDKEKEKSSDKYFKLYTLNMINLLKHVTVYLAKMNCHDYSLVSKKPSLLAASTIYVAMKICEQINKEEYVNDAFTKRLQEISRKCENDIIKCAQKILNNAQNFDSIFTGLENLKRVHFNAIIELKCTK